MCNTAEIQSQGMQFKRSSMKLLHIIMMFKIKLRNSFEKLQIKMCLIIFPVTAINKNRPTFKNRIPLN